MSPKERQAGLYRNWVSYGGGAITAAGIALDLAAVAYELSVKQPSPYIDIFTYLICPAIILFGLVVAVLGTRYEAKRRVRRGVTDSMPFPSLDLNDPKQRRRLAIVAVAGTFVSIVLTYSGYNAFLFTESVEFCGKTCHTQMGPEMTAYLASPHARVRCIECHVGGGAGPYVKSKMNGTKQMYGVVTNTYERPIPTPVKGLRPARETCQECHWPNKSWGSQLYQRAHFRYDEKSTPDQISMLIRTGGGDDHGGGIHWHMFIENEVTYVAQDDHLQDIPWVKVKRPDGSTTEYFRTEKKIEPAALAALPVHTMDCMDCHNRPAHDFEPPDVGVDKALASGVMPIALPYAKSLSVDTLSVEYPTREAAHDGMKRAVLDFYAKKYPDVASSRGPEIEKLNAAIAAIYDRNVFPEMKVSWKTYLSNIGHKNSAGCFRCHDGKHVSSDGKKIVSECTTCHTAPTRGPQLPMGAPPDGSEKDWHPWQTPEKHLAVAKHSEVQCHECHVAGRRPKTECNECHSH